VVVGRSVTRPQAIAARFMDAIRR